MLESVVAPPDESGYVLTLRHTFSSDGTRLVSFISTLWLADPEARGTLIEVIAADGTRLNRIEYPYIADHVVWSPDGSHFLAYASGVLPGQTPGIFTADGILIGMLDHGFPMDEALLGIEHGHWLDDTRILTAVGYQQSFVHAAYIWDVTTSQRITALLPGDGDAWRLAEATDDSRFVMWNNRIVRVVDDQGVLLGEFMNDGYADLMFVRDDNALLGWRIEGEPFRVLDLDGTVLGESSLPTVALVDDIYDDFRRNFTADRNLMVASHGDDCSGSSPSLYLWSLEDPATPLADMSYSGYVRGPYFLADLIYAFIEHQPGHLRDCGYEAIEQQLVFWNFSGERVLELPAPRSVTVVDNLLVLEYVDRIEVWGVPS